MALAADSTTRGHEGRGMGNFNTAFLLGWGLGPLVGGVIYDLLGQEVLTLINEKIEPGIDEIEFDGRGMPSGIYYYKLQTGNYSETKKMVLLK